MAANAYLDWHLFSEYRIDEMTDTEWISWGCGHRGYWEKRIQIHSMQIERYVQEIEVLNEEMSGKKRLPDRSNGPIIPIMRKWICGKVASKVGNDRDRCVCLQLYTIWRSFFFLDECFWPFAFKYRMDHDATLCKNSSRVPFFSFFHRGAVFVRKEKWRELIRVWNWHGLCSKAEGQ